MTGDLFEPHHGELRHQARTFVERELTPYAAEWEMARSFPREVFRRAGEVGLFGCKYSPDVGGSGPDYLADAVVTEEITGCRSGGVAASLGAHKDLACLYISNFGDSEQRRRWLPPALAGESIGALAVTEPDAGSDVAAIKTTARRDGGDWVLNGSKIFITNGAWADFVVVAAKTDREAAHSGITLSFADVRLPDSHRLGDEGSGFLAIMRNFAWERLAMALAQVAGAQRTYDGAKRYALERKAFDRPVGRFQVWRHRFADMATRLEAGRALTYAALRLYAEGRDPIREVAMAKLYTSELAFRIADECVQVHGGYGYISEYPAERALRDARLGPIGGGTSEIMREIIGRSFGL